MRLSTSAICLALVMVAIGSGCQKGNTAATPEKPAQAKPGSYSEASTSSPEVIAAADSAISAKQIEIQKNAETKSAKLTLVKIESAQKQVVSGMNFKIQLQVSLDGTEKTADVVVWHQPWRKPSPYMLTSWTWK